MRYFFALPLSLLIACIANAGTGTYVETVSTPVVSTVQTVAVPVTTCVSVPVTTTETTTTTTAQTVQTQTGYGSTGSSLRLLGTYKATWGTRLAQRRQQREERRALRQLRFQQVATVGYGSNGM